MTTHFGLWAQRRNIMILLSLLIQLAFAEDKDVRITEGQIIGADAGDVACYLTIQAKDGSLHHHMADFDLCMPNHVGKHTTFSWSQVNVLAADCEGDVDCGRSDQVWLINFAKPKWSVSIQDNKDGTSVLQVQSGSHSHKIDVPLGGCFQNKPLSSDVFFMRQCYFAGSGGTIGLIQGYLEGLQVFMEMDGEKKTTRSIVWSEFKQGKNDP